MQRVEFRSISEFMVKPHVGLIGEFGLYEILPTPSKTLLFIFKSEATVDFWLFIQLFDTVH